jgi:hypothetical protein
VQVVTNEKRARNELRKGHVLLFASMGLFLFGMAQTCRAEPSAETDALVMVTVALCFAALMFSLPIVNRWGPRYRQDGPLEKALKGLDNRYTLLNFAGGDLPDHLLIGPSGVRVLAARGRPGAVRCRGDRWSRPGTLAWLATFSGDAFRDPTREATRGTAQVARRLERAGAAAEAAAVPVTASIVFTSPTVRLDLEGCRFPVVRGRDLRAHVQRDKGRLRPSDVARVRQALDLPAEGARR